MLAYDAEVYFSLMGQYNADIWPAQIVAWVLGILALGLVFFPSRAASIFIGMLLVACWLWTGIGFHWIAFAPLNFAAPVFAALFVLQAILVGIVVARDNSLRFRYTPTAAAGAGFVLLVAALAVYPAIGPLFGLELARSPMFGVSSQTALLFTLGMLLLAEPRTPWVLAVIPVLWSLYAGVVAWVLTIPQDMILPVSGVLMMGLAFFGKHREK